MQLRPAGAAQDLPGYRRDLRRLSEPADLVAHVEPVPAASRVVADALLGVDDDEALSVGERIDPGAERKARRLPAAVQDADERDGRAGGQARWRVYVVRAAPRMVDLGEMLPRPHPGFDAYGGGRNDRADGFGHSHRHGAALGGGGGRSGNAGGGHRGDHEGGGDDRAQGPGGEGRHGNLPGKRRQPSAAPARTVSPGLRRHHDPREGYSCEGHFALLSYDGLLACPNSPPQRTSLVFNVRRGAYKCRTG